MISASKSILLFLPAIQNWGRNNWVRQVRLCWVQVLCRCVCIMYEERYQGMVDWRFHSFDWIHNFQFHGFKPLSRALVTSPCHEPLLYDQWIMGVSICFRYWLGAGLLDIGTVWWVPAPVIYAIKDYASAVSAERLLKTDLISKLAWRRDGFIWRCIHRPKLRNQLDSKYHDDIGSVIMIFLNTGSAFSIMLQPMKFLLLQIFQKQRKN